MKKCKEIQKYIVLKEFNAIEKKNNDYEKHLVECNNCREYYNSIKELKNHFAKYQIPEVEVPFSLDFNRKFEFKLSLIFDSLKYAFILILFIVGLSFYIEKIKIKEYDKVFSDLSKMENKTLDVILNYDLYNDKELFENFELIRDLENYADIENYSENENDYESI